MGPAKARLTAVAVFDICATGGGAAGWYLNGSHGLPPVLLLVTPSAAMALAATVEMLIKLYRRKTAERRL
jgi:hypothetical protein